MYQMKDLITLSDVAEILGDEEHRLIHLCERNVVVPVEDAHGRGTVRRFSRDNLFCFAVALELQKWGVQVKSLQRVVKLLMHLAAAGRARDVKDVVDQFMNEATQCLLTIHRADTVEMTDSHGKSMVMTLDEDGNPTVIAGPDFPRSDSHVVVDLLAIARRIDGQIK